MIRSWFSPRVRPRPALYVAPPEYARVFVSRAQIDVSRSYRVAHLSVQSGPLLRGLVSVTASVFFSSHYRGVELEQGMLLMLEFEADCGRRPLDFYMWMWFH
ncbi:uncharacterized protein [Physcomitrium patens]|uniref:uncharacterized protein isoform X2 n=1 Tax=Physcomitrium patens TaxID=3218 RepID=UPI000D162C42|nr:uncharacterized protein LOC112283557 isoform X2 [Physcomitrium patens]|eukprot:XP_024378152.1 uncharacterized protein LOC112283557 isoform X2 [Physcomitrella patens]